MADLDALVRTALRQIDYLELLLRTDLPTDRQTVYAALTTLETWRRAARAPAVLVIRHRQAIDELARATVQARALLDELETQHAPNNGVATWLEGECSTNPSA